jgi:branched-chain amino acid transport system ATP-binding protein
MTALLELREVARSFGGVRAVDGLSFDVQPGEILGLIGPNGAGKTTIVNLISGFIKPSSGKVLLDGSDVSGLAPYRLTRLGLVRTFQSTTVFGGCTVLENARRGAFRTAHTGWASAIFAMPGARRRQALADEMARDLLTQLGLAGVTDQLAGSLPYGMQKALGVVIALAARPRIILLDEPVAGLSSEEATQVRDVLIKVREAGITVVVIDHNMRFIAGLCDRVVVVHQGRELAQGTPEIVLANPLVVDAYLGAAHGRRQRGDLDRGAPGC